MFIADETHLHPLGIAAGLILGLLLLTVERRHAALPLIALICFVSAQQRLAVFEIDFTLMRLLIIVGWVRVFLRGESAGLRSHPLDHLVLAYVFVEQLVGAIRDPSGGLILRRLGGGFDSLGLYFLFRFWIRSWVDVKAVGSAFAMVSFPVVTAFLWESATGRNFFSIFGGVPEITMVREGRLRCQGPFSHPILAGCFWVSAIPLMAGFWWSERRAYALAGIVAGGVIAILTASSTPLGGLAALIFAAALFPLRHFMRPLRWGLLGTLVGLHLVMKAPVWHLIARIDMVGGSTGWHRYHLIDRWINNWPEWWLIGTSATWHWGWGTQDLANQYVLEGVRGGVLGLALFLASLTVAYKSVGILWRACTDYPHYVVYSWLLGAMLFTHTMMFFAVSYFGGVDLSWYLSLAVVAGLSAPFYASSAARPRAQPDPARLGRLTTRPQVR